MFEQCGPFGFDTMGEYPRHSLQALDAATKKSRPATDADSFSNLLGHLTEKSKLVPAETTLDPDTPTYSYTTHCSLVADGTRCGIANGDVNVGDEIKLQPAANAGTLGTAGGGTIVGIALTGAQDKELFAYLPKPGL